MSQVGYQLRYWPAIRQLKAFLADKEVGAAHVFRWAARRAKTGGGDTTRAADSLLR